MWVIAEIIDEVAPIHIQHRADGNEGTKANVFSEAPIEDGGAERATLADETHASASRDGAGESRVQTSGWAHHTEAVRSNDAHLAAAGMFHDLTFKFHAFRSGLFKSSRNNDGTFHAQIHGFFDDARHGGSWCDHDDQVERFRDGLQ